MILILRNRRCFFLVLCFLLLTAKTFAQGLTGTVVDKRTREPIIGASVMIKSTKLGTVTDINGNFSFNTINEGKEIQVSYLGYKNEIIAIEGKNKVYIELGEDITELDQVVVIGYGVQRKSDLTGAISTIKSDEIKTLPTTNVVQALQGKASGVEIVQNSGAPGSSTSIRIRGMGTINNSDPLYVVDGIPMENIDYLSSDDIESVEILKDAASAAIYGSRAANGVVLITTRSGKNSEKKLNINFNTYIGWQEAWKEPEILDKSEFPFFADFVKNLGTITQINPETNKIEMRPETQEMVDTGHNWWDELSRKALMQKYNLTLFGGNSDLNYYVSGNYLNTDGIIEESNYERKSINIKLNAKLLENLELGANLTYAREDRRVVTEGTWGVIKTAINYNPLIPIFDLNGNYNWTTPVENLRRTTYDTNVNNFIGQLNLNWKIAKGLDFGTRASIARYDANQIGFSRYNINPETVGSIRVDVSRSPAVTQNLSWDNILTYMGKFNEDHDLTAMVGHTMETSYYDRIWASGTGYGGYDDEFDALNFTPFSQKASGYTTRWTALGLLGRINYAYKDKYLLQTNFRADASSRFSKKNRWGYFPSVSVGWKIHAEPFMESVEWISLLKLRFGWGQLGNNRIGNYAYKNFVSYDVDNDATDGNDLYVYGSGLPTLKPGMNITQLGNKDIRWERTETIGPGVDLNMFNNRFTLSVDFFLKNTKDMLISVPVVYSAGIASAPMQNAGSVRNKGYEVQFSYRDNIGDFGYEIGGNITQVKNEVTSLGAIGEPIYGGNLGSPNDLGYINKTIVGAPIASYFGWKTDGIMTADDFDSNGKPLVPVFASGSTYTPGDMKFVDVNNDGVIDDNDRTFIGTPHPDFFYGFNINLSFKNVELQTFFQGVYGNQLYDVTNYFRYSPVRYDGYWDVNDATQYSNVASDYFDKVWRPEPVASSPEYRDYWGANLTGTVPLPSSDGTKNKMNFRNSDFYIKNGSYLRLKNVQLAYTFPKKLCQKIQLQNLKVYVAGTNLLTITSYDGLDPEIGKTVGQEGNNLYIGIDQGIYPQARSYMFGMIVDF